MGTHDGWKDLFDKKKHILRATKRFPHARVDVRAVELVYFSPFLIFEKYATGPRCASKVRQRREVENIESCDGSREDLSGLLR